MPLQAYRHIKMNRKSFLALLLLIQTILITNLHASDETDENTKQVFISATENRYDPFLDLDKINNFKSKTIDDDNNNSNNNEEEEEIDQSSEELKTKEKPIIVHNQYPYIMNEQMRPSYTTPYDYNPYTPAPTNSL